MKLLKCCSLFQSYLWHWKSQRLEDLCSMRIPQRFFMKMARRWIIRCDTGVGPCLGTWQLAFGTAMGMILGR